MEQDDLDGLRLGLHAAAGYGYWIFAMQDLLSAEDDRWIAAEDDGGTADAGRMMAPNGPSDRQLALPLSWLAPGRKAGLTCGDTRGHDQRLPRTTLSVEKAAVRRRTVRVADPVDLAALLPSWELHLRAERKSPQTLKAYGDGVRAGFGRPRRVCWCSASPPDDRAVTSPVARTGHPATSVNRMDRRRESSADVVSARHECLARGPPRVRGVAPSHGQPDAGVNSPVGRSAE